LATSNIWTGTVGAVALTFGIFYFVLKYTPLQRHRFAVNTILQDWYRKKYVIYSLIAPATVLLTIMIFVEYGYTFHPDKIISIIDLNTMDDSQRYVDESVRALRMQGYSFVDIFSIITASVDKTLEGYYLQSASFVFAENMEVIGFVLLIRRTQKLFQ
jgi:hypothetical protein